MARKSPPQVSTDLAAEPATTRPAKAKANGAAGAASAPAPGRKPRAAAPKPDPGKASTTSAPSDRDAAKPRPDKAPAEDVRMPDPQELARHMAEVASRSQRLLLEFLKRQSESPSTGMADPLNVGHAFLDLTRAMMSNPAAVFEAHARLWHNQVSLFQNALRRLWGYDVEPLVEAGRDKRFRAEEWTENAVFDYIKQSYLLTANWLQDTVAQTEGLDDKTRQKVTFYTKQFADALAPTNFVLTNPEVIKETLKTRGENLVRGLNNLLQDLESGGGDLRIRQTDMDFFKVGENIATTPGKVVYRNDLMEVLQYDPQTPTVYRRPLLIFPPWINKFYILDLQPKNSLIRWASEQGYTVFVVSWVNPDKRLAQKTFENYMTDGVYDALKAVELATGEREVNAIGYCIGGTLLGSTLAHMAASGDDRIKSATFFAAQVDFSEAGELQVFIDDEQLKALEARMEKAGGYLEGAAMAQTFNMLRANDLIWSYVVNNYMLGRDPMRFDLLYWNADTTRMPSKMHLFYLRECYLHNRLAKGDMVLGGKKLKLSKVNIPIFLQSSKEDHIAPFGSVYKATKLYGGDVRYIVAGSGHIAGVINHPGANKYQYWTNEDTTGDIDEWWKNAEEHPGSWWPYWDEWLSKLSGEKVPARVPGNGKLKPICDAPGEYVLIKDRD